MCDHPTNEITVIAKDIKEHIQIGSGVRMITFHVETNGGVENDVEVLSEIMPRNPSVVLIQPCLMNRAPVSSPDKLVTMMGNIWDGGFQFKYRRIDNITDPIATYRFDFLVIS